jgi:hypothetical protein
MSDSDSDSEIFSQSRQARGPQQRTMSTSQNSQSAMQTTGSVTMSHVSNQTTIPEAYHLTGIDNYGSWAFRMKNIVSLRLVIQ